MGLLDRMAARQARPSAQTKAWSEPPFWDIPETLWTTSYQSGEEKLGHDYLSYAEYVFKCSPAVYAAIRFRAAVLSEARFKWRSLRGGPEGNLFGSPELGLLEHPWPNGSTSDLLARMEVTSSLAGNYYATLADDEGRVGRSARGDRRIVHMRPDWVTIVIDSASGDPNALDARVVGYVYDPPAAGNGYGRSDPVTLLPSEVVHFAPGVPDPATRFRGMSWLTPILPEVRADKAATIHKAKFFENGASPQMVVTLSSDVSPDKFAEYVAAFKAAHTGADNAYKTLFLAGGADARSMGATPQQLDLKPIQGMAETRIAMAAGVHPTVLGMSEGLQGSSLNSGNFNAAQRLASSGTLRAWWRNACHSWETLVTPPPGTELWYDDRDIAFLREDGQALASIRQQNAAVLASLTQAGWETDAAIEYVASNDVTRLKGHHTGLTSVQLLPPGPTDAASSPNGTRPGASSNGTVNESAQAPVER